MKNIKLFEDFSPLNTLETLVSGLSSDPRFNGWKFTLEQGDKDIPFLIWNNPSASEEWRKSGYAEDYSGDFSKVYTMPVLAFTEVFGELFAYMLTPEEKDNEMVAVTYDIGEQLRLVENVEDLGDAIVGSLWEMG